MSNYVRNLEENEALLKKALKEKFLLLNRQSIFRGKIIAVLFNLLWFLGFSKIFDDVNMEFREEHSSKFENPKAESSEDEPEDDIEPVKRDPKQFFYNT